MSTKSERIIIVNEIIKTIAFNGRNFFLNKKDNDVAYIFEKNNKLYMFNEYNKSEMCLETKDSKPKKWHHGGTLWGLVKDFKEYIEKGGYTNHNNGYGGLYCNHWGYDDESMSQVRQTALRLGYLKPKKIIT